MYLSCGRWPDRVVELVEHLLEFSVEHLVQALEAPTLSPEDEIGLIERRAIHQKVRLGLLGDLSQPLPLRAT